jgi:hypothetical protein
MLKYLFNHKNKKNFKEKKKDFIQFKKIFYFLSSYLINFILKIYFHSKNQKKKIISLYHTIYYKL